MRRKPLEMESPYREELAGILAFSNFAEAEETISKLEELRRKYESAQDAKGIECCRQVALLGRARAELISRNGRVSRYKRLQKQEMADWFRIWLETPALFEQWLFLRKNSGEFKKLLNPDG